METHGVRGERVGLRAPARRLLIYKITVVVLVVLVTLLLSIIISAPVDYLSHRGFGRGWATLAVLGGLILVFGIAGAGPDHRGSGYAWTR
jgi:hypothetical protein